MYSKEQQAQHCNQLADLLGKVPKDDYHHGTFYSHGSGPCGSVACALGWAAEKGIGNLFMYEMTDGTPYLPRLINDDGEPLSPSPSAEIVFGEGSFDQIFSASRHLHSPVKDWFLTNDRGHQDSIDLLRKRAEKLLAEAHQESLEAAIPE